MKKLNKNALLVVMLLALSPLTVSAGVYEKPNKTATSERSELLILRLTEIKEMDKSEMKSTEKKELRVEVKAIKKELKANGDGVYISIGGLLIVILLLVILL